ncbi:MAG: pilus (MSHA type) biogenesis protein MshL [Gammaproteobacteria bacterium]|jgi:MSHA biogenesis protein MshL|nr:pilus (MSHA type) biogenesis protein MshL [Gammaproteobacteria bacterium]
MKLEFYKMGWIAIIIFALSGCESQAPRQDILEDIEKVVEESIEINNAQEAVPANVANALIPTIQLSTSEIPKIDDERKFDISVNNVPADQFFMSLVDGTSYNMVVHPEVTGTITLNLSNVTVPEVMSAAREVYGFEFVSTKYGFNVLPARLQARIYQINYLNIIRRGTSTTTVSSGSLTNSDSGDTAGGASTGDAVFGTEIVTEQPDTSFWQELEASVNAIVGSSENRSVVINPQSGVVVVRALPNELREVESFLMATQLIVQRQVILEAKIIEVRLSDGFQSGINWSALSTAGNNSITASSIGGGSVLVNESGSSDIGGTTGSLNPANNVLNPIDGAVTSAFGGVFTLALNLGDFTSFIELLKTQGNVQVLSSPRVATMNNQKAVIKVGTDEFFVTDVSTTNTNLNNNNSTSQPNITLTPFFSGIALDVTPQISGQGEVTLHIHPTVSEVLDQQKTVVIGNLTQQLPLALSTVRESDSVVRAKSGQVIVLGGLMQDIIDDRDAGAPGLSDVPYIGNLFKHKKKSLVKSELVILLKPIVVENGNQWSGALNETAKSLKALKNQMKQFNQY